MHPISFQFKRAHLSLVAAGRRLFRGTRNVEDADFDGVVDMTPARFDILYLIYGGQDVQMLGAKGGGWLLMAHLTRRLGLSRATISKATDRLVELGLITKGARSSGPGKILALTKEGRRRIRLAFDLVFGKGKLARRFGRFFALGAPAKGWRSWIDDRMTKSWKHIRDLGRHFGDTSEEIYLFRWDVEWNDDF